MRVIFLATVLLASSSLCPSFAQEAAKPPIAAPQTTPTQPEQKPEQERDRLNRGDDRGMGGDWRMHRGYTEGMARDDREMRPDRRLQRDRGYDRESGNERERYSGGDNRGSDRADTGRSYGDAYDEDRPRRRVKVCIEYENGDEYCRYKGR